VSSLACFAKVLLFVVDLEAVVHVNAACVESIKYMDYQTQLEGKFELLSDVFAIVEET